MADSGPAAASGDLRTEDVDRLEKALSEPVEERDEAWLRSLRARVVLNEMYQYVGLLSPEGTLLECNQSVLDAAGLDREDVIGKPVWETYWWAVDEQTQEDLKDAVRRASEGEHVRYDVEVRVGEEGLEWIDFSCKPVYDSEGEVAFLLPEGRNIEAQKSYEQKLAKRNEQLQHFAHTVSHDLQEPLRMVSSYLELLRDRYEGELDEEADEFIDYAVDGAQRMGDMIRGLLEYSRVESRGGPPEPIDLETAVDQTLRDLEVTIEESGAQIEVEELPRVKADEAQMAQLFQNLISNAIKFSGDEPPRVEIEAQTRGDVAEVTVRDHGVGFDPDHADRLFEIFHRHPDAEDLEGMGVGLAVCKRIVDRHGGDIEAESGPGEGATFRFTLPLAEEA